MLRLENYLIRSKISDERTQVGLSMPGPSVPCEMIEELLYQQQQLLTKNFLE
jgi:hypothetical protein